MSMEDTSADTLSPPDLPPDSPGSSVSSRLQEEYSELLKHVVSSSFVDGEKETALGTTNSLLLTSANKSPDQTSPRPLQDEEFSDQTPRDTRDENGSTGDSTGLKHGAFKAPAEFSTQAHSSHNQQTISEEKYENQHISTTEPTVAAMGQKLDVWLDTLKANILAELRDSSVHLLESQRQKQEKEMEDLISEKQRLERELNRACALVATCEQSMARKDSLLENLSQALAKQRDKTAQAGCFFRWRVEHLDGEREKFTEKIASLHHERQLRQRVLKAWFGQVQTRWRTRVQKQCQEQAQAVCRQLTSDYEAKISELNSTVSQLQAQVQSLQQEREAYAESVKKAFMRGVCALNMEAMSAFSPDDAGAAVAGGREVPGSGFDSMPLGATRREYKDELSGNLEYGYPEKNMPSGKFSTLGSSHASDVVSDRLESQSLPIVTGGATSQQPHVKGRVRKDKVKTKKPVTGGPSSLVTTSMPFSVQGQGHSLAPPMASVVVERHQPITKTVGRATASKYPRSASNEQSSKSLRESGTEQGRLGSAGLPGTSSNAGQTFKPLAGQTGHPQTIKVVD
ncbi:centrosomal protein POC5 isoform X2 [Aplysia californica]|uniref:Centrosomal protein POC5 n=1 Tax=Aplysia californica TaxID=6500 RepID=A0ABM1VRQ5_APLCA|nr:centrosomal protein POC5 isoform X2 [Aplysia californica]